MDTVFTIGHSNHDLDRFVDLLRAHGIDVVMDTRSQPYSKYSAHFNREALKSAVAAGGMQYVYLGRELGGRPENPDCYDHEGHVLYGKVAETALFQQGIERVAADAARKRLALVCSEEDPIDCHRRLLVGRVLVERGLRIEHIRGDGSLQSEDEMRRITDSDQLSLFDAPEATSWRSTRSVLPKRTPNSSLAG